MSPLAYSRTILAALQDARRHHVYAGTVTPAEVTRRRKANRAARKSRRINRQGTRS